MRRSATKRTPPHRTGGGRLTREAAAARAEAIERAYLESGGSTVKTCARTGASRATVYRVLSVCRRRWAAEAEADRPALRAEHRRRIVADMAACREQKRWGSVATFTRLLLELDGMLVEQLEVTAKRSPFDGLTVEQLDEVARTGKLPRTGPPRLN